MLKNILKYTLNRYIFMRKKVLTMSGMFLLLGGGLLIIIFAVVVSVVSSVVSAVAFVGSEEGE